MPQQIQIQVSRPINHLLTEPHKTDYYRTYAEDARAVHRGASEVCGKAGVESTCPRPAASREALLLAARSATGVIGLPDGLIVKAAPAEQLAQEVVEAADQPLHESRACLIAFRDKPGGELKAPEAFLGVFGCVPNEVLPNRHCCS